MREPYSYRRDDTVPPFPDDRPIIVYDGHCAVCSGWARFVLRHDHRGRYRLLPAQAPLGRALYRHYGLDPDAYETNILIAEGRPWFKSEGSLRMAEGLGFPWSLVSVLRFLPQSFLDWGYLWIARNRLRLFGRRDICYRVEPGREDRFLT